MSRGALFTDKQFFTLLAVAVVVGLVIYFQGRKVVETAQDAVQAVNPMNHDNIFNRGFNSLYQTVTGSTGTLGTDLYDFFNPPEDHW